VVITIPIPEKISLNKIYAGVHFSQRSKHKDAYYWAVFSANPKPYTGSFPAVCHYHFKLRGTELDISNLSYMTKMTEDALVACGVLPDDTPKYVNRIILTSEKIGKNEADEVVVHISSPGTDST
jgi:hypothetical protein